MGLTRVFHNDAGTASDTHQSLMPIVHTSAATRFSSVLYADAITGHTARTSCLSTCFFHRHVHYLVQLALDPVPFNGEQQSDFEAAAQSQLPQCQHTLIFPRVGD